MKKVAVIIVTYNRLEYLKDLINSIRNLNYKDYDIIAINNSSNDGTEFWLNKQNDVITITQENCGGAGGFHTGLKFACEKGYKFAWVMDDDVLVKSDTLDELINNYSENIGFLCSKVVDEDNNPCNVPGIDKIKQTNGEEIWNEMIEKAMVRLEIASFVSVFISTDVIKHVGLPYKEFFIWGDDTEYTKRISVYKASYLCGKSIVIHRRKINGTLSIFKESNKNRIKNYFYFYRNNLYYHKKYSGKMTVILRYIRTLFDLFHAIFTFKFGKAKVIFKAFLSSFTFNPKVLYICKE